jgi:hypothetical protein
LKFFTFFRENGVAPIFLPPSSIHHLFLFFKSIRADLELLLHLAADLELAHAVLLAAPIPLVHDGEGVLAAGPAHPPHKYFTIYHENRWALRKEEMTLLR